MSEVVNLRMARKRAARRAKETVAQENRTLHGRTRAEREHTGDEAKRAAKALDGARRDDRNT